MGQAATGCNVSVDATEMLPVRTRCRIRSPSGQLNTVKPTLNGPFIKRNLSYTEIFLCPVTLGLKQMLNILD